MKTFSDRQRLYCQNTHYKQCISVFHIPVHNFQISRKTQALEHNPVPHPSPNGRGVRNCANSKIDKQKVLRYRESQDLYSLLYMLLLILINCFAVCFARCYTYFHLCSLVHTNYQFQVRLEQKTCWFKAAHQECQITSVTLKLPESSKTHYFFEVVS